jgi:hypothetical protein
MLPWCRALQRSPSPAPHRIGEDGVGKPAGTDSADDVEDTVDDCSSAGGSSLR